MHLPRGQSSAAPAVAGAGPPVLCRAVRAAGPAGAVRAGPREARTEWQCGVAAGGCGQWKATAAFSKGNLRLPTQVGPGNVRRARAIAGG